MTSGPAYGSTLVVGERVVSRSDEGLLAAEYALFDRSDVLLASSPSGHAARENGYVTTAGFARTRLVQAGIAPDIAGLALGAIRSDHLVALATAPAVLRVLDELGPCEAFEGGSFVAATGRYTGTWLDLDAIAEATSRQVVILLQAIHLFYVVDELPEDVPVRLYTPLAAAHGKPGERTWRKVPLDALEDLPAILRAMPAPSPVRPLRDEADVREDLLRNLHVRASTSEKSRSRLHALASHFAGMGRSAPPVLDAPSETWRAAVVTGGGPEEAQLSSPNEGHETALFERFRQDSRGLQGADHLRAVAEFLSSMADRPKAAPEFCLLASRAWLAAGDPLQARRFATRVVDDASAPDGARLTALEIIETASRSESVAPPPPTIAPVPIVVLSSPPPAVDPAPPCLPRPPPASEPTLPGVVLSPGPAALASPPATRAVLSSRPPPPRLLGPEVVETLPLPLGADDSMLPPGTLPASALEVRIAMTRLSRDLGRDYRLWYGTALKTDPLAIDAMQRHLRRRFEEPADAKRARQLEKELIRHGALLSEILARRLGGEWVDVASQQPADWAMTIAPEVRVWPIGRVYRFFRHGHHESDLVAFFLDLEPHARRK